MGIFDILKGNKKNNATTVKANNFSNISTSSSFTSSQIGEDDINRLLVSADEVMKVLVEKFTEERGVAIKQVLIYASGLAGFACHRAVKEISPNLFMKIGTNNGKTYYFGDAVNKYFIESKYSVVNLCQGAYKSVAPDAEIPDVYDIISTVAKNVGDDSYRIMGIVNPAEEYVEIKNYFNEIYESQIVKFCKTVQEEPVLLGIVLHKVLKTAMQLGDRDNIFAVAIENACYISKMDDDSI